MRPRNIIVMQVRRTLLFRPLLKYSPPTIGTGRPFHIGWARYRESSWPGLSLLYEELQIYLNLWSVDILNISDEQVHVSQPDMNIVKKACRNNLTCYWPVPLLFVWQDLGINFFEFDAGHWYDRSMPYMFEICVFENSSYCRILHQDFWLMQMDLWSLVPMRRNYVLLGLSFSSDPVIKADTAITQCCNF